MSDLRAEAPAVDYGGAQQHGDIVSILPLYTQVEVLGTLWLL